MSTSASASTRLESDSFGTVEVPADRLWGAQTQRSLTHFDISGERQPRELIDALALVKHAAAAANLALGLLPGDKAQAIMAAADEAELVHMTYTAALHDSGPIAFRYPRGNGTGVAMPEAPQQLEIGKGRIIREGKKVAILSLGTRLAEAMKAAETLDAKGLSTTVADLRFAKPLDEKMIRHLIATHEVVGNLDQDARAVAHQLVGTHRAAMVEVLEDLQALLDDRVRLVALDVRDETDATGVVFIRGAVQTGFGCRTDFLRTGWRLRTCGHGRLLENWTGEFTAVQHSTQGFLIGVSHQLLHDTHR